MKSQTSTKKVKAWITVSDWANAPTTHGEYYTRKEPKPYLDKIIPCTITYVLPTYKKKKV